MLFLLYLYYLKTISLCFVYENYNFCAEDVLTEQAILKWYTDAHLAKSKDVFLRQMKPIVDWLETAEEESDSETKDSQVETT